MHLALQTCSLGFKTLKPSPPDIITSFEAGRLSASAFIEMASTRDNVANFHWLACAIALNWSPVIESVWVGRTEHPTLKIVESSSDCAGRTIV